jgi:twitching motility two-component system response regulator PilG
LPNNNYFIEIEKKMEEITKIQKSSTPTEAPNGTIARAAVQKMIGSPAKALQHIASKKLSGRLTIRNPNDRSVAWRVYVGQGNLHFATSVNGARERLAYHLTWYDPHLEGVIPKGLESDYQLICHYWKTGYFSLQETRKLLFFLTQEALMHVLSLPKAIVEFEKLVGLDPILISVPFKSVILPMRGYLGCWGKIAQDIPSPFQRFVIEDLEKFAKTLWKSVQNLDFIRELAKGIRKHYCLYDLARHLKTDTLALANLLVPVIRAGIVEIAPYREVQKQPGPLVACIDDSKTTQRHVKLILEAAGYRYLKLTEPAKALSVLARHKPDLILLDINMPAIDGYELCRMLRQSQLFESIPIVMLTGRDGAIDRMRSRMVGASNYLTKPCEPQKLIETIEKERLGTSEGSGTPPVGTEVAIRRGPRFANAG